MQQAGRRLKICAGMPARPNADGVPEQVLLSMLREFIRSVLDFLTSDAVFEPM
jgi:hypothetical protein